jgi:DNA-binding winged helix-turn-helix (wHTH) protein
MQIHFGALVLDRAARQLRRGDVPQELTPKAYDLLDLLVLRRPAAVSKQEIHDHLWPDTYISESTLSSLAAQVRRALGDDESHRVRTVHGFGYAFEAQGAHESAGPRSITAQVFWNRRTFALAEGENVLGRDPGAHVRIDVPGVSRRHARIVSAGERFLLEDLGSKNGTYLRDRRLEAPAPLADRDEFRLGNTSLVFRVQGDEEATVTEG